MLPEHRGALSGKGKLPRRGEAGDRVGVVGRREQGRGGEERLSEGEAVPNQRNRMSKGTKACSTIIRTRKKSF